MNLVPLIDNVATGIIVKSTRHVFHESATTPAEGIGEGRVLLTSEEPLIPELPSLVEVFQESDKFLVSLSSLLEEELHGKHH